MKGNKKTRRRTLMAVITAVCLVLGYTTAFADSWGNTMKARDPFQNAAGQTVYQIEQNGVVVLEILARNNNVYNKTKEVLLTDHNLGPNYVAIDKNLIVMGVDKYDNCAWSAPIWYESGQKLGKLSGYGTATGFQQDSYGLAIGVYTARGLYTIATDSIIQLDDYNQYNPYTYNDYDQYGWYDQYGNYYPGDEDEYRDCWDDWYDDDYWDDDYDDDDYDYDDEYPTIYWTSSEKFVVEYEGESYKYTWTSNGTLKHGSTTIATDVDYIAVAPDGRIYCVDEDGQVKYSKIGSTSSVRHYADDFIRFIWVDEDTYSARGVKTEDETFYFDD